MKKYSGLVKIFPIILSFIFLTGLFLLLYLSTPVSFEDRKREVRIPKGATYSQGIKILKNKGIIKDEFIFLLLSRITATDTKLKAGYYKLSASMRPWDIFNRLRKGMIIQYTITIPDGSTLEDIRLKFKDTGLIDDESWQLVYNKDFLNSLNIDAPSLEGYIYPDTYNFAKGMNPEDIFSIMVQKLRENFDYLLRRRAEELGMSKNEVLTLASIIEKEALFDKERPIISAVYHNRLKKSRKLQADPTVTYGINKKGRRIRTRDLRRATPYNTYIIKGLPPGPIASPGIKSIRAALYPADVDYMYFVSKNDGTHYFSQTDKDHLRAVRRYQRSRKKLKR